MRTTITPILPVDPGPLPHEPPLWYRRYCLYRDLGPNRTLEAAFHASGKPAGRRPGHAWYATAEAWQWSNRAAAWDAEQRRIIIENQCERHVDARLRRQTMLATLLEQTYEILLTIKLDTLEPQALHALLPTIRGLFRDLLTVEQREYELPALQQKPVVNVTPRVLRSTGNEIRDWQIANSGIDTRYTDP